MQENKQRIVLAYREKEGLPPEELSPQKDKIDKFMEETNQWARTQPISTKYRLFVRLRIMAMVLEGKTRVQMKTHLGFADKTLKRYWDEIKSLLGETILQENYSFKNSKDWRSWPAPLLSDRGKSRDSPRPQSPGLPPPRVP